MQLQALVAIAFIVAFAFTVEVALGFGSTVVTVALGSLLLPIDEILPAFVPVNVAVSAILVARNSQFIAWRVLLREVLPFVALGFPIGIFVFSRLDEGRLKLAFGAFVVVLSAIELSRSRAANGARASTPVRKPVAVAFLAAGGMVHGAFGTGGPMVVYVLGRTLGADKARFRATLSVLWLTLNSILVVTFALQGKITAQTGSASALFLLSLGAGFLAGEWAFRRVSPERFRTFVFVMLAAAGCLVVARNI